MSDEIFLNRLHILAVATGGDEEYLYYILLEEQYDIHCVTFGDVLNKTKKVVNINKNVIKMTKHYIKKMKEMGYIDLMKKKIKCVAIIGKEYRFPKNG